MLIPVLLSDLETSDSYYVVRIQPIREPPVGRCGEKFSENFPAVDGIGAGEPACAVTRRGTIEI
jgi:hypothetical protein